jgi:DNA-binding protein YbaB
MPNMDSGAMMKNAQNMTNNMQMPNFKLKKNPIKFSGFFLY